MPKVARLQLEKAGAKRDEEGDPDDPRRNAQAGMKQFRAPEPKQDGGEKVGGRANNEITETGEDSAKGSDEILGGPVRRRDILQGTHEGRSFGA